MSYILSTTSRSRVDNSLLKSLQGTHQQPWSHADVIWCHAARAVVFPSPTSTDLTLFLLQDNPVADLRVLVITEQHLCIIEMGENNQIRRCETTNTVDIISMALPYTTKTLPNGDEISFRTSAALLVLQNRTAIYVDVITNANRGVFVDTVCECVQSIRGDGLDVDAQDVCMMGPWLDMYFPRSQVEANIDYLWKQASTLFQSDVKVNVKVIEDAIKPWDGPEDSKDSEPYATSHTTDARYFIAQSIKWSRDDASCHSFKLDEFSVGRGKTSIPSTSGTVLRFAILPRDIGASRPSSPARSAADGLGATIEQASEDHLTIRALNQHEGMELNIIPQPVTSNKHDEVARALRGIRHRLQQLFSDPELQCYKHCSNNTRHETRLSVAKSDRLRWTRKYGLRWHRGLPLSKIRYIARLARNPMPSRTTNKHARRAFVHAVPADCCLSIMWHERELNIECERESHCSMLASLIEEYLWLSRTAVPPTTNCY